MAPTGSTHHTFLDMLPTAPHRMAVKFDSMSFRWSSASACEGKLTVTGILKHSVGLLQSFEPLAVAVQGCRLEAFQGRIPSWSRCYSSVLHSRSTEESSSLQIIPSSSLSSTLYKLNDW